MYKLLILLTISTATFAYCDYTLETISNNQSISIHSLAAHDLASGLLIDKNYNIVDNSMNTIVVELKADKYLNRHKVKSLLYRRNNGSLINYSYGEGRSFRAQSRAFQKKEILLATKNSIKQLPNCNND